MSEANATQCILVCGNPIDGLTFVGPFNDPEEAGDYAHGSDLSRDTWVVTQLESPAVERE
ncbi:hypothetical protein [Thioalkalivibrio sp. ALE16]|uniref:hypothetical protein n=1 Tax=Thioalkalivibrio sp. ALE16 TaxID=1158172 RepID=UPI0003685E96|nr:hypothetical protein [Thioalkalivibrio sp. ALE16]